MFLFGSWWVEQRKTHLQVSLLWSKSGQAKHCLAQCMPSAGNILSQVGIEVPESQLTLTKLQILEIIGFERQQSPRRCVSRWPGTPLDTSMCTMESVKAQAWLILLEFCNDSVRQTVQTFDLISHPRKLRL